MRVLTQTIRLGFALAVLVWHGWAGAQDPPGRTPSPYPAYSGSAFSGPAVREKADRAEKLLVLRSGEVLRGRIEQSDGLFRVVLPHGEIRLGPDRVAAVAATMEEAYLRRRELIQIGSARDHLDLAAWCRREGLIQAASQELDAAAALEPDHPMIGVLRQQLAVPFRPTPPPPPSPRPVAPQTPTPASAAVPSSALASSAFDMPSAAELEEYVATLPTGAVREFSEKIQPKLLTNCTSAGCHVGRTEHGFWLVRPPLNQSLSPRLTNRNLQATMKWIDAANPRASRLLTAARTPHGTVTRAAFAERDESGYRELSAWVHRVVSCEESPTAQPSSIRLRPAGGFPAETPSGVREPFATPPPVVSPTANPYAQGNVPGVSAREGQTPAGSLMGDATPLIQPYDSQSFIYRPMARRAGEPSRLPMMRGGAEMPKPMPRPMAQPMSPANGPAIGQASNATSVRPAEAREAVPAKTYQPGPIQRGAALPSTGPSDPFDPTIFNRRFWPNGPPRQPSPPEPDSASPSSPATSPAPSPAEPRLLPTQP